MTEQCQTTYMLIARPEKLLCRIKPECSQLRRRSVGRLPGDGYPGCLVPVSLHLVKSLRSSHILGMRVIGISQFQEAAACQQCVR